MQTSVFLLRVFLASCLAFCVGCRPTTSGISDAPIRTAEQWHALDRTKPVEHLVCGGSGMSRLVTYIDGCGKFVAVEAVDQSELAWPAPYRAANPRFRELPVYSNGHGRDQLEKLLALQHRPEVLFRLDMPGQGISAEEMQRRTGIPVVLLPYGNLSDERGDLFGSLRLIGEVLDRPERAEEVIAFFEREIAELKSRTADITTETRPTCYIGGVSYRGAHGLNSTTQDFAPFEWLAAENTALRIRSNGSQAGQVLTPREQLTAWDPDYIFIDMASLTLNEASAVEEIRTRSPYRTLKAVENNRVYLLLPNSSYNINYDSQLANAWFIGSVLYPERFRDIDPAEKARDIFQFLTGDTVLEKIENQTKHRPFEQLVFTN